MLLLLLLAAVAVVDAVEGANPADVLSTTALLATGVSVRQSLTSAARCRS
jgi:hypothetical protein